MTNKNKIEHNVFNTLLQHKEKKAECIEFGFAVVSIVYVFIFILLWPIKLHIVFYFHLLLIVFFLFSGQTIFSSLVDFSGLVMSSLFPSTPQGRFLLYHSVAALLSSLSLSLLCQMGSKCMARREEEGNGEQQCVGMWPPGASCRCVRFHSFSVAANSASLS